MVPKTSDGRVLFGVPWHNRVILGTTDIPVKEFILEPKALDEEIDFILETAGIYLKKKPQRKDILCVFAGLRPLAAPANDDGSSKTRRSGEPACVSSSGLLHHRRQMDLSENGRRYCKRSLESTGMEYRQCRTKNLPIHGLSKILI